jgi:RNA polymerase sigma-70 factor (ECF subfamily)
MIVNAEQILVRRCLRGDPHATVELVKQFEQDVVGLCLKMLRHQHDAEDVAQEVFLRVFRSLKSWDSNRPLRPWILTIAVNRCRTAMGKRAKRPELVDYLADVADRTPVQGSTELTTAIQAVIADLRQDYREVFILYHETGRNYDEIAEIVSRPVGTIKTWLHRARQILASELQQRGLLTTIAPEPTPPK